MSRRRDVQASLVEMDRKLRELQRELELVSQPAEDGPEPDLPRVAPAPAEPEAVPEASAVAEPATVAEPPPVAEPAPAPGPPAAAAAAQAEADAIIAAARAEAARIVDEAAAQVAEIGAQIDEFQRLRTELQRSAAALVQEYERALRPADEGDAAPPSAPPASDGRQFEGQLVVDVGPFHDIEALRTFEQALAGLPQTEDVYVRGFEGNRALIDLKLTAPVPLLDELRGVLPYTFELVETGYGRVTIDVQVPGEPGEPAAD